MQTLLDRDTNLLFSPPEAGCVLYLPGLPGSGSKVYDRSPYGNIGTIYGATWKKLPSGLWCLSFDNVDDYINCGTNASLTSAKGTIALWAKRNASGQYTALVHLIEDASQDYLELKIAGDNKAKIEIEDGNASKVSIATSNTITDTNWHHLAYTQEGSGVKIYVDGEEQSTSGTNSSYWSSHLSLTGSKIGTNIFGSINGYIALPRIYNRPWSALDVQNSFNREKHLFGVW